MSPNFDIILCGSKIRALADTGASVNIISESDYHKLKEKPNLKQSKECVYSYVSIQLLNVAGQFTAVVHRANHDIKVTADFLVVPGESRTLLSLDTSQALNLIKVVAHTSSITGEQSKSSEGVKSCKGEPVRITIDESVPPVAQPHRRVPFHMRKLVEQELAELEKADIIEKVEGATPWVSPIVVVPKPSDKKWIRICVDMREANRAICRERHLIPMVEEIALDLNGCSVFSKIDLKQGYHQFLLHPESRKITTFGTHIGLY